MPNAKKPAVSDQEFDALLLKVLEQAGEGMPASSIRKALPAGLRRLLPECRKALEGMARCGEVHFWPVRKGLYARRPFEDHVRDQILAELQRGPRTRSELAEAVKTAGAKLLPQLLKKLVATGVVFEHPAVGRRPCVGLKPADSLKQVREQILAELRCGPRTRSELAAAAKTAGAELIPQLLKALIAEGVVFEHPALGRRRSVGLKPADPLPYVGRELNRTVTGLVRRGFRAEAVREAIARWAGSTPPAVDASRSVEQEPAGEAILRVMRELNPQVAQGSLVYLPHLRTALRDRFPDKVAFDRAVLALLEQQRIQLQAHPVPSEIKPAERESMIDNGSGSFYMLIGLRR